MDSNTTAEYRNGILNLMVEHLGVAWGRSNILEPYGSHDSIPDANLPAVYARAQTDALAGLEAAERA